MRHRAAFIDPSRVSPLLSLQSANSGRLPSAMCALPLHRRLMDSHRYDFSKLSEPGVPCARRSERNGVYRRQTVTARPVTRSRRRQTASGNSSRRRRHRSPPLGLTPETSAPAAESLSPSSKRLIGGLLALVPLRRMVCMRRR